MEHARPATSDDLAAVVALADVLVAELAPTRGGDLWRRREAPTGDLAAHYATFLDATERALFVGTIDDAIVGFASVRIEVLHDATRLGVIDELFVEPAARAVAVGESLANEAVAWCDEHGCIGVDARALPGNRAAKNFFETHGFVARSIVMHRPSRGSA
jgi:GNAT superfamily N-acetyltransferase